MYKNIKDIWKSSDPILRMVTKFYISAIFIILFFPILFTLPTFLGIDFSTSGQIGDTIGGLMGPFVAIIAASLTFFAFWVQYRANQIQIKNFNEQRKDIQIERFQNKLFELIRLHRLNVEEIIIKNKFKGREAFSELFYELRYTFYTIKKLIEEMPSGTNSVDLGFEPDDDETIIKLSYGIFFFGLNSNFKYSLILYLKNYTTDFFIHLLVPKLESVQSSIPHQIKFNDGYELNYNPHGSVFEGYNSKLGHYYRHLFQAVKFVDKIDDEIISPIQKYDYIKTLRAQLSNSEQLLLYYNSISYFGHPWLNDDDANPTPENYLDGFLLKYKMIKNIPLPLADFGIRPEIKFHKEIEQIRLKEPKEELFEWHEIINR